MALRYVGLAYALASSFSFGNSGDCEDQRRAEAQGGFLLEDKKVVYEFQHSPLSPEELDDRNAFYNSLGYKVIWIFDLFDQYENGMS